MSTKGQGVPSLMAGHLRLANDQDTMEAHSPPVSPCAAHGTGPVACRGTFNYNTHDGSATHSDSFTYRASIRRRSFRPASSYITVIIFKHTPTS